MAQYTETLENGAIAVYSTDQDQVAQVCLHPDGYQITVDYLMLLPYKKPEWTEQS